MLLQTSCQMALLYFSVVISNKMLKFLRRSIKMPDVIWWSFCTNIITLLELCLYMLGL